MPVSLRFLIPALLPFAAFAQSTAAPPVFEVASIRPHQGAVVRSGPFTASSPLIRLTGYTVFGLVMDAYNLHDYQLSFGSVAPKEDIYGAMYDIAAKAPGDRPPNPAEFRAMLQALLADRFSLRVHRDSRELPVYTLVVAKGGPKLKPGAAADDCHVQTKPAPDGRNTIDTFTNCPVDRLAERLGNLIRDRPVLDQTGLTGRYDFRLTAIPEFRTHAGNDPADISPFTAVGDLGLRIQPEKARIDILVVDHVERPSEN